MSNLIRNRKNLNSEDYLRNCLDMNNGLTSVYISVLSLRTSDLTKTKSEIDLAIGEASVGNKKDLPRKLSKSFFRGEYRSRTGDLLHAMQTL